MERQQALNLVPKNQKGNPMVTEETMTRGASARSAGIGDPRPHRRLAFGLLIAFSLALVSGVSAAAATGSFSSGTSTTPQPSQSVNPNPPKDTQDFPTAPGAGGTDISQTRAVDLALQVAQSATTPAAPANSPTWAQQMTYQEANASMSVGNGVGNLLVDPTTEVWVVTVHAPVVTDGSPAQAPQMKQSYTVILDAANGKMIDDCIGCSTLSPAASVPAP